MDFSAKQTVIERINDMHLTNAAQRAAREAAATAPILDRRNRRTGK
jgi:hypothetical protein